MALDPRYYTTDAPRRNAPASRPLVRPSRITRDGDGDGDVERLQTANEALTETVATQADEIARLKAEIASLKGEAVVTTDRSGVRGFNDRTRQLIDRHNARNRVGG